jgi:hypothetical protein
MAITAQQLDGLINLLVEAVLRDLQSRNEDGAESAQGQRRRGDQVIGILHDDYTTADPRLR